VKVSTVLCVYATCIIFSKVLVAEASETNDSVAAAYRGEEVIST